MRPVTHRQKLVLDCIREELARSGRPPTFREIGKRLGIRSTNGVADHLRALRRKGLLEKDPMKARGTRVVGDEPRIVAGADEPDISPELRIRIERLEAVLEQAMVLLMQLKRFL